MNVLLWMIFMLSMSIAISTTKLAFGAACCTGAVVMPTLITNYGRGQVTVRTSGGRTIGRSRADGSAQFYREGNDESTSTTELSSAYALSDRWQLHGAIPANYRHRRIDSTAESHWGLGDVTAGLSFEALEEWDNHPLKPRAWLFFDVTAPTGRSIYDAPSPLATTSHGRGAWSGTIGTFILKVWSRWDAAFVAQHVRSLAASHTVNGLNKSVQFGPITALTAVGGYNMGPYRLGLTLGPTWEQATIIDNSRGGDKLWWSIGAQASRTMGPHWMISLSYNDQTVIGPTYNATLSRSAAVTIAYRY
jgi:hypothetical protein